jgi:hypothetical protein
MVGESDGSLAKNPGEAAILPSTSRAMGAPCGVAGVDGIAADLKWTAATFFDNASAVDEPVALYRAFSRSGTRPAEASNLAALSNPHPASTPATSTTVLSRPIALAGRVPWRSGCWDTVVITPPAGSHGRNVLEETEWNPSYRRQSASSSGRNARMKLDRIDAGRLDPRGEHEKSPRR